MSRFKSEDAWLINPDHPGRSKKRKVKAMAKRRRSHSRKKVYRRKKSLGYSRKTKKAMAGYGDNPPRRRRRHHTRRYRDNPNFGGIIPSKTTMFDAVYVTGGFITTKIAANTVLPMIGINQPIVRVGVKAVLAGLIGWAGGKVLGRNAGQFLMIGGLVEAVNDVVQTYVTPYVPALSVSSYPGLESYVDLSAYPDLSGMVSQEMDEQV